MSERVQDRQLAEHFSRYVDYRRQASKKPRSFSERLEGGTASVQGDKKHLAAMSRAGRRHRPPVLARAKEITSLQAQRLARYAPVIEGAAKRHGVPVELICGVILQESGGNPRAVSHAGAKGLMQLMPATARRFGVRDVFDPVQNIVGGTRYLRFLLDRFGGDLTLAIAGYNAGEGNVEKYGNRIPPFRETQGYVPNVLGYTQRMIDIFASRAIPDSLPANARRV